MALGHMDGRNLSSALMRSRVRNRNRHRGGEHIWVGLALRNPDGKGLPHPQTRLGNAGSYWEGGFGEGLGLPVIYTCEKSAWNKQKTHFDTNHLVTIIWDLSDLKRAGDALAATIRATLRADGCGDRISLAGTPGRGMIRNLAFGNTTV
jgi:hypothetical protein